MEKGLINNEKFLLFDTKQLLSGAQDSITVNQRLSRIEENIDKNIILVFDEIHTLFEMGLSVHSLLLNSPVIVTTTNYYYSKFVENDNLLRNRFFVLKIRGLTEKETRELLTANLAYLQRKHKITIPPALVDSMLKLVRKYLPDNPLPDKCFQLLEKAQAKAKIQRRSTIIQKDLFDAVSDIVGLPPEKIGSNEYLGSREFENFLGKFAFDKDNIIKDICNEVRLINSELNPRPDKPKGMFLFIGPKGCGKTSLAKGLAQYLFGSENKFFYFDMANFQSGNAAWHLISKSKASEEQEGQLYSLVREHPFMLLFFDNIQLAHPDILNLLANPSSPLRF